MGVWGIESHVAGNCPVGRQGVRRGLVVYVNLTSLSIVLQTRPHDLSKNLKLKLESRYLELITLDKGFNDLQT